MAAAIALGKALAEPAVSIISSFLEVKSVATTCGDTEENYAVALIDVMLLADCPPIVPAGPHWLIYSDSLELDSEWI